MTCTCGHSFADHHDSGFGVECMGEACRCASFRELPPMRVCCQCQIVIADGSLPASHGLCPDCIQRLYPELDDG